MKNRRNHIVKFISRANIYAFALMVLCSGSLFAQGTTEPAPAAKSNAPVKNTFNSVWLIDNHTVMVPIKGTFEADIQHRFGLMNKRNQRDLWGLFAPSNIRLGVSYCPINDLMVGAGITKDKMQADLSAKYAIIKQGKSGGMPVSVTVLGNVAIDTRETAENNLRNDVDRLSYFSQLMVARKINDKISLQAGASISWFNNVEGYLDKSTNEIKQKMHNEHIAFNLMGRYKVSNKTAVIVGYDQPITEHTTNNPYPNVSFGFETTTSAHAFQIFATTYSGILPQYNNVQNNNDFTKTQFLIGFNITRLWNW